LITRSKVGVLFQLEEMGTHIVIDADGVEAFRGKQSDRFEVKRSEKGKK